MPTLYRKLKSLLCAQFYWSLDYLYITRRQFFSVIDRTNASQYRNSNSNKPSVILIPGIYEHWQFMKPIATLLHQHGYDVHVIEGLGYNRQGIESMAEIVQTYINSIDITDFVIIAHSKGGLIGKYLMTTASSAKRIHGMIALNTPFSGSRYAYLFLLFKSLRIFIPNSTILRLLSQNQRVNQSIVSIYSQFDPHIPGGSKLKGAKNIELESHGHFRIVNEFKVHQIIIKELANFILKK